MALLTIASVVILASSIAISVHENKVNRIRAKKAENQRVVDEVTQMVNEYCKRAQKSKEDLEAYRRSRDEMCGSFWS
jgi:DNA topoisomerase IA